MSWECPACGLVLRAPRPPALPVVCPCGVSDRSGAGYRPDASPPPLPAPAVRIRHGLTAAARWLAAGRPTRTDEQAHEIYRRHCAKPCEWWAGDTCRHPQCGCRVVDPSAVSPDTPRYVHLVDLALGGLWNKLKWATEVCPAGYWS